MISSSSNDIASRPSYVTLSEVARLLRKEMDHLRELLSNERAARIREKLDQLHSIPLGEQLRAVD
jgi:excinuclease UvrABC nuclease subunit